jgi:hypothetical protein
MSLFTGNYCHPQNPNGSGMESNTREQRHHVHFSTKGKP